LPDAGAKPPRLNALALFKEKRKVVMAIEAAVTPLMPTAKALAA
jgi:hypothetical protein